MRQKEWDFESKNKVEILSSFFFESCSLAMKNKMLFPKQKNKPKNLTQRRLLVTNLSAVVKTIKKTQYLCSFQIFLPRFISINT